MKTLILASAATALFAGFAVAAPSAADLNTIKIYAGNESVQQLDEQTVTKLLTVINSGDSAGEITQFVQNEIRKANEG